MFSKINQEERDKYQMISFISIYKKKGKRTDNVQLNQTLRF